MSGDFKKKEEKNGNKRMRRKQCKTNSDKIFFHTHITLSHHQFAKQQTVINVTETTFYLIKKKTLRLVIYI